MPNNFSTLLEEVQGLLDEGKRGMKAPHGKPTKKEKKKTPASKALKKAKELIKKSKKGEELPKKRKSKKGSGTTTEYIPLKGATDAERKADAMKKMAAFGGKEKTKTRMARGSGKKAKKALAGGSHSDHYPFKHRKKLGVGPDGKHHYKATAYPWRCVCQKGISSCKREDLEDPEVLASLLEREDPNIPKPKKPKKAGKKPAGGFDVPGQDNEFYDGPGARDPSGDVTQVSDQGAPYMSKCMCYGGKFNRLKLVKISCKYKQAYNKRYKDMNPHSGHDDVKKRGHKRTIKKGLKRLWKTGLYKAPAKKDREGKSTVKRYGKVAGPSAQKKSISSREATSKSNKAQIRRMISQQKKGLGLTRKEYEAKKGK